MYDVYVMIGICTVCMFLFVSMIHCFWWGCCCCCCCCTIIPFVRAVCLVIIMCRRRRRLPSSLPPYGWIESNRIELVRRRIEPSLLNDDDIVMYDCVPDRVWVAFHSIPFHYCIVCTSCTVCYSLLLIFGFDGEREREIMMEISIHSLILYTVHTSQNDVHHIDDSPYSIRVVSVSLLLC